MGNVPALAESRTLHWVCEGGTGTGGLEGVLLVLKNRESVWISHLA